MEFGNYLGFIVFGLVIVFLIYRNKTKNSKTNNSNADNISEGGLVKLRFAKYVSGIDYLTEGQECDLIIDSEKLIIKSGKNQSFNISLEQIINAGIITKKEVEMKNKSAIGRGIVGGVLTGGVGLLLGGLSGVGQKVKNISKYFLVINYKSKNTDDIKIITFGLYIADNRFAKALTSRIKINPNIEL